MTAPTGTLRVIGLVVLLAGLPAPAGASEPEPEDLDAFSPAFLGMYRKLLEVDADIARHASRYGVDVTLARAVCLYESGANPGLRSHAGALGYFQVMPGTFRELGVESNIEAGVKYLGQLLRQFGREDRAVAAYNGGPGRVGRGGGLPLETLQYVIGVGYYRTVLRQFEPSLRRHAAQLQLTAVRPGEDWPALAARLGLPEWQVRWHNPFLAGRPLMAGALIAAPLAPRPALLAQAEGGARYRIRHGDHYIKLAVTLGIDPEALRAANGLWHTEVVPAGTELRLPLAIDRAGVVAAALVGPAPAVAAPAEARPATAGAPAPTRRVTHRVVAGDTLGALARRYGSSVAAIRRENRLPSATIQPGQRLEIPLAPPRP